MNISDFPRSHDELRAALIEASKHVRKLQFGRRNEDPLLAHLRQVLRAARTIRAKFNGNLTL